MAPPNVPNAPPPPNVAVGAVAAPDAGAPKPPNVGATAVVLVVVPKPKLGAADEVAAPKPVVRANC